MRVAALYDIHANPVALRAVLAQLEREQVDLIVVGGDAVPGPLPRPTIELLERSATAPSSCAATRIAGPSRSSTRWPGSAPIRPRAERPAAAWTATMIDQGQRDFLASFQEPLVIDVDGLGATLFCHGSPRSDEEILTLLTPEGRWAPMSPASSSASSSVATRTRSPTATHRLRHSGGRSRARGGGWPGVDDFLRNSFLEPADPLTVAEALERQAQET